MMNTKGKLLILILCISFIVFPGCYGTADIEANEIVREDEQSGPPVREHIVESESASEPELFEADEPEEKDDEYEYAYGTHQIRGCLSESSGKILTVDFKYNEIEYPYDAGSPLMAEYIISAEILMDQKPYQTITFEAFTWAGKDRFEETMFPEWKLADINFDGYTDLLCLSSAGLVRGNYFSMAWRYDPVSGLFVQATEIEHLPYLKVNSRYEVLHSSWYTGSAGHWEEVYRYQDDGTLLMTDALNYTCNDDGVLVYREYKIEGEEKIPVFEIEETEENDQAIHARYYDPDNKNLWYFGGD